MQSVMDKKYSFIVVGLLCNAACLWWVSSQLLELRERSQKVEMFVKSAQDIDQHMMYLIKLMNFNPDAADCPVEDASLLALMQEDEKYLFEHYKVHTDSLDMKQTH